MYSYDSAEDLVNCYRSYRGSEGFENEANMVLKMCAFVLLNGLKLTQGIFNLTGRKFQYLIKKNSTILEMKVKMIPL